VTEKMDGKCKATKSLDIILGEDRIYYQCIEERKCEHKVFFENASTLLYCGKKDYVPYGRCVVNDHKYFDGYFHFINSHGICSLHLKAKREELKRLRDKKE